MSFSNIPFPKNVCLKELNSDFEKRGLCENENFLEEKKGVSQQQGSKILFEFFSRQERFPGTF